MNANRDQIKKESPSNNAPDMAKTAGELWKTMSKSVSLHLYTITRGYLMSGSCHLNRALNVEIGVECQIFVIFIFFNCGRVLQFGARYYKDALTQKISF